MGIDLVFYLSVKKLYLHETHVVPKGSVMLLLFPDVVTVILSVCLNPYPSHVGQS